MMTWGLFVWKIALRICLDTKKPELLELAGFCASGAFCLSTFLYLRRLEPTVVSSP